MQDRPPAVFGMVMNENEEPIPYASVALYSRSDSALVGGGATNDMGRFRIEIKPGDYYIVISFLSYKDKLIDNIQFSERGGRVGRVILESGAETLGEVTVAAERPEMELKLDKRVFNIQKDITNQGLTGAEILDNLPSVEVDVDGNVSLRGSGNVRILVDGKPSGLVGISSSEALRQLQGDMIESIEVITNPSARYDAEGEVGIINIILKKQRKKGTNGSLNVRTGYPNNHGASINVNFRKEKFNLFTSYGVNYRERPGKGFTHQEFNSPDTSFIYDQTRDHNRGGLRNNARFGTDLYLNKRNTLTISGLYSFSEGNNDAHIVYKDLDSLNILTQTVVRDDLEEEDKQNIQLRINHEMTFKQKGRKWTIEGQWSDSDDNESSLLYEYSDVFGVSNINQRTTNTEDSENWFFQSDYIHPFGKSDDGKFETGLKATLRTVNNDYLVEQEDDDGQWNALSNYDNQMVYQENIYAAYVMAGNKYKNFSYQLGLRSEYSDITTDFKKTNEVNRRDYIGFFPSAHFSYEIKKQNFLQLSYTRRINRPRFWYLLPFFSFSDSRSFFSGNPNLDPAYTHSTEISHLVYWEKGSLLSSIYFRYKTGLIDRILFVDSNGFRTTFPVNLGIENSYGLEFSGNYELQKWWSFNGSFNFYRAITDGNYNGRDYNTDTYAWQSRFSSKWKIKKKLQIQGSIRYRSPRNDVQGEVLAFYSIDAGASIDILKGNGTLRLSARDLLNTRKRRSILFNEYSYTESEFQWRSRQTTLRFT